MKKLSIFLGLYLVSGLLAFAGIGTVTIIFRNVGTTTSTPVYSTWWMRTDYPPLGYSGNVGGTFTMPALAANSTYTYSLDVSGQAYSYPWAEFGAANIGSLPTVNFVPVPSGVASQNGNVTVSEIDFNQGANLAYTNAPTVYTNYTMTLANNTSSPANAVWTYNGSIVKSEILQPGTSDTWTTPSIEVSPVPQNFTLNGSVTPVQSNPQFTDTGGQPVINFGDTGTPINLNLGGSGSTVTNTTGGATPPTLTVTATNSPTPAPTNLVTFSPSSGNPAQEPTLQAGFQLLHADNLNTLNGFNILNNSINGVMAITNAQGQEIALLYSNQYYDGVWLPKIYAAITNLGQFPTNLTVSLPTNSPSSSSNVFVQNWPQAYSNYLGQIASNTAVLNSFTNSGSNFMGNFNSASNQMMSLIPSTATNASAAIAAATAAEGDYGITAFLAALSPSIPADASSIPSMQMNFCARTVDFNPLLIFPNAAAISYLGLKIIAELFFLLEVGRMFWELVRAKASTSTGGVPDLEIFGGAEALTFGGEFGGNFIGAIVAVLIPVAFILIWSVAMAYLFSNLGFSISQAMNISTWAGNFPTLAWSLLTTFIPVNTLFTLFCTRITLQFTMGKIVSIAANASRFLWGK